MRIVQMAKSQRGYALLAVVIVLSMLAVASLQYLGRTAKSIQVTGYARDSTDAMLLAESAMNMLYGRLVFDGDLDNANGPDNRVAVDTNQDPPAIPLPYMFYVTAGDGIDQRAPSLLQRVADGEAAAQNGGVTQHRVTLATTQLRIDDLFNRAQGVAPILFVQDPNDPGDLSIRNSTWSNTNDTRKAAAWLELTEHPTQDGRLQVFVQAVAQVGNAKSYVQRFAGEFSDTLGRNVGALNEANPAPGSGRRLDDD